MVLFANTNNVSNNEDLDLASLAVLNEASAECVVISWINAKCDFNEATCWYVGLNAPGSDCSYGY